MEFTVNTGDCHLHANDLLLLLSRSVVELKALTPDVRILIACFSNEVTEQVNPIQILADVFPRMVESPIITLRNEPVQHLVDYFSLLKRMTANRDPYAYRDLCVSWLHSILVAVRMIYQSHTLRIPSMTRQEEICKELIQLVSKHYVTQRKAQFYANELGISLQHLSTTVKQVTGKNVLDIIASVVIMDAKNRIKNSRMTIQEIAYSLNFPSASFFGSTSDGTWV